MLRIRKDVRSRIILLLAAVVVLAACVYTVYRFYHPTWPPVPTAIFPPPPADRDIHIPLRLSKLGITVKADIDGKTVLCRFDTGSARFLGLPASFHISGQATKAAVADFRPYYTARPRYGNVDALPQVRLGDYTVRRCPTFIYDSLPDDNIWDTLPVMGNSFFANSVVTFDFKKHTLTVHRQGYQVENERLGHNDQLLPFRWKYGLGNEGYGYIVFQGKVEGQPVEMSFDTGVGTVKFVVASPRAWNPLFKHRSQSISRRWAVGRIENVTWTLGKKTFIGPAYVAPRLMEPVDAVVGLGFLRGYRVTIDYPGQKMLLQRAS